MAKLNVVKLGCVEETDEIGSDDLYVVVFIGKNPVSGDGVVVTSPVWSDLDTGEVRSLNDLIDANYNPTHLYLVALMEEDANKDITGQDRIKVQNWMKTAYQAFGASGSASLYDLAVKLIPEMQKALNNYNTNDDLVGIQWLKPLNNSGNWRGLHFIGDGGDYWVRFMRQ